MNRLVLALLLLLLAIPALAQESLGDIARQQRAAKKPVATVITNDELATRSSVPVNVVGVAPAPEPEGKAENAEESADSEKAAASAKASTSAKPVTGAEAKPQPEYSARYAEQKSKLDFLQRELGVLQRELKLQTAAYYADAGTRLRDDKNWAEQNRKFQEDIAAKQKEIAEAREQLDSLADEARKVGVPTSSIEH